MAQQYWFPQEIPTGELGNKYANAEGAMVPKTLRQMDRRRMRLWKANTNM
jgi:hypothetical protein